jgi:hypothetical protein
VVVRGKIFGMIAYENRRSDAAFNAAAGNEQRADSGGLRPRDNRFPVAVKGGAH